MGFLTRLLAGLTAAAALGAGLTGTANAVDVTGATGTTKSVVKLTADDTNNLPDHIVNGSFDYPSVPSWTGLAGSGSNKNNKGKRFATINPGTGKYGSGCAMSTTGRAIPNWNRSSFAWNSTQGDAHYPGMSCEAGNVELNYDSVHHNQFAELTADQQGTAIYQDVKVTPGTMMTWSLKHSSATSAYVDKMQVMIGEPYKETAQEATRIASENGNKVGEKMTTISTPTTSDRADNKKWDTYSGTYLVPDGVTTVRFTFKSVASAEWYSGNDLDDIEFSRSYKLTYDKNSADASGQVPSNQRGKENTTQPAKSKTTGTVKTVVDTSDGLPTELVNGDFEYPGADVLSQNLRDKKRNWWGVSRKDKMVYESDNPTKWVSLPSTFDSDRFAWDSSEAGKTSGVQEGSSQWHTNEVELQRDSRTGNMYAELSPYQAQSSIRQYIRTTPGALYKVRLKHASLSSEYLDKMQVLIGADGNEQPVRMTRVESQNGLDAIGESTASTTISTHASNKAEISWGSGLGYHSSRNHDGQWATYEGVYVATSDVTVFTFKSVDSPSFNTGNLLDDVVFTKAYKLTYDKNSADASGQVPSNQRGKENTVQPAKAEAGGTVRTIADASKSLTVNPGFDVPDYSKLDDGGLHWMYVNPSEGNAWSYYDYINPSAPKHQVAGLSQATFGWQELTGGDHKTTSFELHREKDGNVCADVHGNRTIGQTIDTQAGVAYTVSIRHSGRSKGNAGSVQVLVGPDKDHLQPLEMSRMNVSRTGAKYGDKTGKVGTVITTHSDSVDSTEGDHPAWDHSDDWETYSGTYVATGGKTVFAYRGVDENGDSVSGNDPVADSVIDDLSFKLAYRLSYDKNAADAAGSIPSDEYGKENTVRQAKSKANGSVKLVADDDVAEYAANGLPKQIMNGDFDHDWRNIVGQSRMSAKYNFANIDPAHGDVEISGALNGKGEASKQWVHLNGFDASRFGWKSNQTDTRVDGRGGIVEIQRSRANDNMYAEITASQANTYLYQDIDTAHDYPTVYTVKLRYAHRNGTINSNEKIQILVGAPGHEQPVEMTRIASDRGNRLGEKSTTVNAPNTDGWLGSWDTFQGSVVVPAGRNVSRFTFKALGSIDGISGNLIDDVQFKLAYKLSYDKNSQDAFGQVPSDETANTVKQTKARTTGTVRAVADDVDGLPTELINGDFQTYGNEAINRRPNYELTFVDGSGNVMTGKDINGTWGRLDSWDSAKFGWKSNDTARGHSSIVEVQRPFNTPSTSTSTNVWGEIAAASQGKYIYQDIATTPGVMYKWSIKHASRNTARDDSMQVLIGEPGEEIAQEATRTTSNGSDKTGKVGTMITTHGVAQYGQWETYTGTYIATSTVTRFTFKSVTDVMAGGGSDSAEGNCIDDVMFMKAYKLTYDKNAADATGSVPSNTTPGTTQTVSSRTEGKVSDLVQRTTTHEDGSVTVRTVDTTTGVVSGCQVYYPAGQKITLATMAKDDDCWDSSMLSRPGHTQLGWNQDRNATQAQAEVTMVEGGMTVYAVWVGNPVLTYDTNKPSTWSGQMPSTPASVSVAYNTAAADGSGWRAGDTTKIRGYRFLGWYTGPQDNAGLYDWNTLLTGNVTVYAHWQRLQANVIYDKNASDAKGSHANTTGWQYSDVTIPGDTSKSFTRDGYVFKGWSLKAGKADVVYKDGSQIPLQDKDITLYAQWQGIHENFTETGGISLPLLIAGGIGLLVMGVGSTVMLTRRMNGHGMPDGE